MLGLEGRRPSVTEMEACSHVPAVPGAQGPPGESKGVRLVAVQRPDRHVEMDCLWEQTKISGRDQGISRPDGIQMEGLVVLELYLGPFDLLAPLERCKRENRYGRRVAREIKLGTQRGPEGESNHTLPGLPCTCCAALCCAWPSLSVHGAQAGQGEGGWAMQATLYCYCTSDRSNWWMT